MPTGGQERPGAADESDADAGTVVTFQVGRPAATQDERRAAAAAAVVVVFGGGLGGGLGGGVVVRRTGRQDGPQERRPRQKTKAAPVRTSSWKITRWKTYFYLVFLFVHSTEPSSRFIGMRFWGANVPSGLCYWPETIR